MSGTWCVISKEEITNSVRTFKKLFLICYYDIIALNDQIDIEKIGIDGIAYK